MNRIENLTDLRLEIKRLNVVKASREQAITNDIRHFEDSLKPANLMAGFVKGFYETDKTNLVMGGVNAGVNLIIDKLLFRKSNFIVRGIMSVIGKNIAGNLVKNNSNVIMDKVKDFIGRFIPKKNTSPHYFDSTYQEREVYNNDY